MTGRPIVFERDFKVWQLDTKSGEAYAMPITLVGSAAAPEISHLTLTSFNDLAVSPDGRKIALIAHGEVFAASARDGGAAFRVTHTPGPETQVAWAPDSTRMAYVSERDAVTHVFLYDFAHHTETQLTKRRAARPGHPVLSRRQEPGLRAQPQGIARDRPANEAGPPGGVGIHGRRISIAWSPDNQWIAYVDADDRGLRNVYVVAGGGRRRSSGQLPREHQRQLGGVESRTASS